MRRKWLSSALSKENDERTVVAFYAVSIVGLASKEEGEPVENTEDFMRGSHHMSAAEPAGEIRRMMLTAPNAVHK